MLQPLPGREPLEQWLDRLGCSLNPAQWSQLEDYLQEVSRHNEQVNITSDSGEALYLRHGADALAALPVLRRYLATSNPRPSLLDLGAGAGFIGITLKIAWPDLEMTLLEASRRKFQFLSNACARLKTPNLHVILGRAPEALHGKDFDAVIVRAVAHPEESARLGLSLARPKEGLCVSYQTLAPAPNDARLDGLLREFGARLLEVVPYRLPEEESDRHLVIFQRSGALNL